jgi:hypothetical protein
MGYAPTPNLGLPVAPDYQWSPGYSPLMYGALAATLAALGSGSAGSRSVGRSGDFAGNYFKGDIGEIAHYSTALSDSDRAKVENALKTFYGVA